MLTFKSKFYVHRFYSFTLHVQFLINILEVKTQIKAISQMEFK